MVKNIVFDIGDVLVEYSPEKYVRKIGISQLSLNKANDILIKDKRWREYLNGNIEVNKLLLYFKEENPELEKEFEILLLKEHNGNILHEINENTNLLKELSEKYQIYLLSNITKETFESIQEQFDFVHYIKGGVYSYIEHISKPEKKIYETLIERYQLNSNETIYIDDRKKNIEAINDTGIIGIQYKKGKSLRKELGGILD